MNCFDYKFVPTTGQVINSHYDFEELSIIITDISEHAISIKHGKENIKYMRKQITNSKAAREH